LEAVKVWGFSMCVSVVIGAIVSMIAPSLGKQKIMKMIISVFVLVGVLSPLINILEANDFSIDALGGLDNISSESKEIELSADLLDDLEINVTQSLFPLIKQELSYYKLEEEFGVNVKLNQQKDGISIDCVNITLMDLHKIDQDVLTNDLEKNLGLPISVDVIGNKGENAK